jgi:hypothetical protein
METPVFMHYTDPSQKFVHRETRRVIASYAASRSSNTKVAARNDSFARPLVDHSLITVAAQQEKKLIQNHKSCPEERRFDAASFVVQDELPLLSTVFITNHSTLIRSKPEQEFLVFPRRRQQLLTVRCIL